MYSITVTEVGDAVEALLDEKMLVLFGPTVPKELREICVVHDGIPVEERVLRCGLTMTFGDQKYRITDVGDAADTNFRLLGHLSIVFGNEGEPLPGAVRVSPSTTPEVFTGEEISFS